MHCLGRRHHSNDVGVQLDFLFAYLVARPPHGPRRRRDRRFLRRVSGAHANRGVWLSATKVNGLP